MTIADTHQFHPQSCQFEFHEAGGIRIPSQTNDCMTAVYQGSFGVMGQTPDGIVSIARLCFFELVCESNIYVHTPICIKSDTFTLLRSTQTTPYN